MRAQRSRFVLLAAITTLAGCQGPDVGQECTIRIGSQVVNSSTLGSTALAADVLETGIASGCDETLVCIASPVNPKVAKNPYCSKACVSNEDCFQSETGLVCRPVVLDQIFLRQLDPAVRDRFGIGNLLSSYCAAPLQ